MREVFSGIVANGQFTIEPYQRDAFKGKLARLEGKTVRVTIDLEERNRTLPQNRYYWGVVIKMLSADLGYDEDIVHALMKEKFNPFKLLLVNKRTGEIEEEVMGESTRKLSTIEFNEYCEKIRRWSAEYRNLYIPEPNEVDLAA